MSNLPPGPASPKSSAKVLVVDDSRLIRAALTQHLRTHYAVREAQDGDEAWQTILLDPAIQVVITDLDMNGMGGIALLQKIRSSKVKRISTLPVIVNSASEEEDFRQEALKHGANDFINKDVRAVELLARVDSMLRLARTQKELDGSREALSESVTFDPATQMATPHLLQVHLGKMWAYVKRHGGDLSVVNIRLDRMRLGMDGEYGPFVEQLEAMVGALLACTVRKEDCLARTGDCEFSVASVGIDAAGARAFALRLCKKVETMKVSRDGRDIKVTASAGVSNLVFDHAQRPEELQMIAQERLDDAQAQGGDQVAGGEVTRKAGLVTPPEAMEPDIDTAIQWILQGQDERVLPYVDGLMRQIWPLIKFIERAQRAKQRVEAVTGDR